jgi:outer membrane protein assembly factor BamB
VSRDLVTPLTPLVINGVVFAVSSGEARGKDAKMTASQRAKASVPAVVYALDAATGKELWNSGKAIASFMHGGGISGGAGQIYLGTHDGMLYSFGFPIEH